MDRLAGNFLSNGDVANASSLYNSLEKLNPTKYSRMARICRVLADPQSVPLPFRYDDICDALLDPTVPHEVLLRTSTEEVQKSFQRLAVCVHPDKNPNPRAKDAFLRLTQMRDMSLQLLHEKTNARKDSRNNNNNNISNSNTSGSNDGKGKGGAAAAAQQPGAKGNAAGAGRRPQKPPLSSLSSTSNGGPPATKRTARHTTPPLTPVMGQQGTGFDQLRHTTIKLNCFKRKDIADDFEMFSSTTRTAASSAMGSSSTSLADAGEDRLAATVPMMPRGTKAPMSRRRCPPSLREGAASQTSGGGGPHSLATPLPPPQRRSSDASAAAAASASLVSGGSSERSATASLRPSPPPPPLPRLGEREMKEDPDAEGEVEEGPSSSLPSSLATLANDDAIRHQIDQTCLQLQEMRKHNTNVRLKLDLSFEAYQRSKQDQRNDVDY